MTAYRKKPLQVEAVRWTGGNEAELAAFAGDCFAVVDPEDRGEDAERTAEIYDRLHSTWVGVHDGHWIVRGTKDEFYPIDDEAFAETYEPASAS